MKTEQKYTPVGCDFVDQIEILATQRKQILLVYVDNAGQQKEVNTILRTWETKNKEEFLFTEDGLRIRLDNIVSLGGVANDASCKT